MNRRGPFRAGPAARNALWAAAYALLAVVATAPFSLHPASRLPDDGDAPQGVWIAWWAGTHLLDPARLLDGNAYYPHPHALLYSEPLIGEALLGWPLLAGLDNTVLAVNLLMLATLAFSALAVHLLARELTGSEWAGPVAASLYALGSYTASQLPRLQLVTLQWMPLALLFLLRFARGGRARDARWLVACTLMVGLGSFYYLAFFAVALLVLVPVHATAESGWRPSRRGLRTLAVGGLIAVVVLAAVVIPFLRLHRHYGFTGDPASFDLASFFAPPWGNHLYGMQPTEVAPHAVSAFLGYATLALALLGLWSARRRPDRRIWTAYAAVGAIALLLAAGPDLTWNAARLGPGPFRLLQWLPPFSQLREPGRFAVLALLATALLAALGASVLMSRLRRALRPLVGLALAAVVLAEQRSPPRLQGVPIPAGAAIPEAYRWLAARGGDEPLLEAPVRPYRFTRLTSLDAYFSTLHRHPILLARPSVFPPAQELLQWELRDFPDARSIALLQALGVRLALVHPARFDNPRFALRRLEERADRLPLLQAFPDRAVEVSRRYQLGGERLYAIAPAESEPMPRECDCMEIERAGIRVAATGSPQLAIDGRRDTKWTSGAEQKAGHSFKLAFDRPRRVARIEIEMAYPYGEFPRFLAFAGERGGAPVDVRHREDIGAAIALVRQLVADPQHARLRYDLETEEIDRLRLYLSDTDWGALPWAIVEIHVFEAR